MLVDDVITQTRERFGVVFNEMRERIRDNVDNWQVDVDYFDAVLVLAEEYQELERKLAKFLDHQKIESEVH